MSMTQRQLEEVLTQIAIAESLSQEGKAHAEGNAVANQIATDAALARQLQVLSSTLKMQQVGIHQYGTCYMHLNTTTPGRTKGALELYIRYVQKGLTGTLFLKSPVAACNCVRVESIANANQLLGLLRDVQSAPVIDPAEEAVQHVMRTATRMEARRR